MKQFWSKSLAFLLCLALLAGMLPATALAAAPPENQVIYVGGVVISSTGYWTTDDEGNVTAYTGEGTPTDNYIYYGGDKNTLTLHNATIKNELGYSDSIEGGTYINGSAIGVFNQNGNAELTIQLQGQENTLSETSTGIHVYSHSGTASLTITGSGSLNASGFANPGISVQSNNGDATLTIQNAEVTATSTHSDGVRVLTAADKSASLTVDGGSLTATATGSNSGIYFQFVSGVSGSGTPRLTVCGNTIVKASGDTGGITSNSSTVTPSGTGIVFNNGTGTVYGDVTLQEDLTIGEDESLTIGKDASLTVPSGTTLTNNGTVTTTDGGSLTNQGTINNSGTLPDSIEGSQPPKITTASLPNGEVDTTYNQTLGATGSETITWSLASGSTMPAGLTLNSDGTITGTPTTARQFTFTATATNSAGSDSKEYELTINAPQNIPVNGVTLNPTLLSLFTGGSETLTATVEPSNATNKNVTWSSDKPEVATVENGKVTAKAAGTATITVTTEDGEKTATCTVTVTDKTYKISADATALDFGNAYTGYAQPAAKTVTITNDGNQDVTVTLPTSTNYIITAGTGFTNGSAAIEPDGTATFTVQPKAGLAVGTCSENITVTGTNNATLSITASFTVKQYSSGGGTPTKTPSQQATDKIESAKEGSTVEITLRTGQTKLDKEVFEELAGRDVTLEISLSNGVTWTVNGQDIPENADLTDLDLGVSMNTSTIPVDLINAVTGEIGTVQLTLKHDGEFGFTMTLTAPVGAKNAGLWANLYHYDEDAGKLAYQSAALVDEDGNVALPFDHASQYALVLDSKSHDLPFTDLAADAWYTDAVAYVYRHDIMEGMSATTFQPNGTLSRAMAVQIFYNLEGQPDVSDENLGYPYEDVDAQAWYGNAVYWARLTGVATGYGDGTFQPTDSITRQEFAQMLYNYAEYKGYDLTAAGDLSTFPDAGSIADWAETAMSWANGNELINGHDDGTIDAAGAGTRAQAASILMRFDQNLVEK